MDEGGERCQSNPHCERPQLFKKNRHKSCSRLFCYTHLFDVSKIKKKKSRPKSQILEGEKKGHLDVLGCLFFFNLLLYEPNFTEQIKPILIVTGCGATKRSSVHSSGPHFIQDMWQGQAQPWASPKWKREPERKLAAPPFLLIPCEGADGGLDDDLQLKSKPPFIESKGLGLQTF